MKDFLPISKEDLKKRGWNELDIILVTGDAYVDHPSYGAVLIGRMLEKAAFKVGIIAQPDWRILDDFKKLGRPKLFFGVTAGNIDSMLARYTANKKIRNTDDYSPGGRPLLRPERASIVYANKLQEAFKGVPIVLGGIEASMRRLAHYDYWSDKVRRSLLVDSKADILVYGMGEKQILEIACRLKDSADLTRLENISGTVIARKSLDGIKNYVLVPSFEEIAQDKDAFNVAFEAIYSESDPISGKTIAQKCGDRFLVQYPPAAPLTTEEMDGIYALPYMRNWHPVYNKDGGVPGFETVRNSITSHRGCSGGCSFCSLYLHQGRIIQSRSIKSVAEEIAAIAEDKKFRGTITDIGGPTANMYMAVCPSWKKTGACRNRRCLVPEKCKNLTLGYEHSIRLWKELKKIPRVKHVFVGSGVRYDLLIDRYSDGYLHELCAAHVSGQLKVAPEHCTASVLELMNKPAFTKYEKFIDRFETVNKRLGKKQYLVNYFISGHPGARLEDALELAVYLAKNHIHPEQVQDYIPLPMTISGAMYYTGKNPLTGKTLYVAKTQSERAMQRALLQYKNPQNRKYILRALKILRKESLKKLFRGNKPLQRPKFACL
ncbi:MAG: YgiQ family radical SAM protein [Candidatus Omnitrophica bacterium]|nr:YgiQ family radical SAM protein [Candidatus Omnitrophota bacterium]